MLKIRMKKLIMIWLTALMLLSVASRVDAKCREALPDECKVDFDFVLEQAEQYADVLRFKPLVDRCIVKKNNLELRIVRGSMTFDVTLFDVKAHSCRVEDGVAYAVYRDCGFSWKTSLVSFLSGAGIMFIFILFL